MNQARRQAIYKQGPVVALAIATVFFAVFVHAFSPLQHWLFWRFAAYWIVSLAWVGSCLAFGHTVLGRVFAGTLRKTEQLTLGLALGVLAFGLAIFLIGLGHGLNTVTFFLLPGAFYAVGLRTLMRDLRRLRGRLRLGATFAVPWWVLPILAAAVLGASVLYAQILSPDSFSYDVRWYHMTLQPDEPAPVPAPLGPLASIDEANRRADFIVIDDCRPDARPSGAFVMGATRGSTQFWVRDLGAKAP